MIGQASGNRMVKQPAAAAQTHAPGCVLDLRGNRLQTGDGVAQNGEDCVENESSDGRGTAQAEQRDQQTEQGEGGDGEHRPGQRQRDPAGRRVALDDHAQPDPDHGRNSDRDQDNLGMFDDQRDDVRPAFGEIFGEAHDDLLQSVA